MTRSPSGPLPVVLLLHGLDGIGAAWSAVADRLTATASPLRMLRPDLAGHGRAPRLDRYDVAAYADELAARLAPQLDGAVVVVGHSLGGVVALRLAAAHPELGIVAVAALSMKTDWPESDIAAMVRVADKGVATFDDEAAARHRFLRVSGLDGLMDPAEVDDGVTFEDGRWQLRVDPEVHRVEAIDVAALVAAVPDGTSVVVATGELDAMAPPERLRAAVPATLVVAGAGHNVHVERPDDVAALVAALLPGG